MDEAEKGQTGVQARGKRQAVLMSCKRKGNKSEGGRKQDTGHKGTLRARRSRAAPGVRCYSRWAPGRLPWSTGHRAKRPGSSLDAEINLKTPSALLDNPATVQGSRPQASKGLRTMTNQEQLRVLGTGTGKNNGQSNEQGGVEETQPSRDPQPQPGQTEKQACYRITPSLQNDKHYYQS